MRKRERTFSKDRQVNFDDFAVEAKDSLEMGLYDISGEICDDDDLGVRVGGVLGGLDVHVQGGMSHRSHSGNSFSISIRVVYASSSTYLWRMSFHSFCAERDVRDKVARRRRRRTYALVPALPEGSHADIEADSEQKCTRKDGANKDAWKTGV